MDALQALRSQGRIHFAQALEELADTTAQSYSESLFSHTSHSPLETTLQDSFKHYFDKHLNKQDSQDALNELWQHRTLQTTTHVTLSEGATFFATHWLASCGLDSKRPYLIAAFSGVPFSNQAWSGCLNYGHQTRLEQVLKPSSAFFKDSKLAEKNRMKDCSDKRLSMLTGQMRDALVYQSHLPERLLQMSDDFQNPLSEFVPPFQSEFFTDWAMQFSQNLTRHLLPQVRSIYFDINQVIANYLVQVLTDKLHPVCLMLYGQDSLRHLSGVNLFCCPSPNGQKVLQIQRHQLPQTPDELCEKILQNRWCPAPFLVFSVLTGLNQFCCFGGFEQVEYFAKFQKIWESLEGMKPLKLRPQQMLTTGRFVDSQGLGVFPIDLIVNESVKASWSLPSKKSPVSLLMQPIVKQLLATCP